jgi:hypothetical protein
MLIVSHKREIPDDACNSLNIKQKLDSNEIFRHKIQVKVLQKKFTLLHADVSKIVFKYSNEVHLLRYLST